MAFCALVGGQDELVFDGHSFVCDHDGEVIARAPQFAEHMLFCDVDPEAAASARLRDTRAAAGGARGAGRGADARPASARRPASGASAEIGGEIAQLLDPDAEVYAALVLATRDYVTKNGFEHVVIGLSGGIDSTLVLLVAVDALGADARDLRDDAVAVLLGGHALGCQDACGKPRRGAARAADRRRRWPPTTSCSPSPSPGASPT